MLQRCAIASIAAIADVSANHDLSVCAHATQTNWGVGVREGRVWAACRSTKRSTHIRPGLHLQQRAPVLWHTLISNILRTLASNQTKPNLRFTFTSLCFVSHTLSPA